MHLAARRAKLARMDAQNHLPLMYCPRCRRSTQATSGREFVCPICGGNRQLLQSGYLGKLTDIGVGVYERSPDVEMALQIERMHITR
ncbi:MAG: hypothetical protein WD751_03200 [Anaerolineales bacterium]